MATQKKVHKISVVVTEEIADDIAASFTASGNKCADAGDTFRAARYYEMAALFQLYAIGEGISGNAS